ncbi:MAG: acetylxylan esterase, partial [Candidatus Competibacteraceae bacterium]|nr:acetylxylan esterase [Candidatus Competibacteraceae bacterium]
MFHHSYPFDPTHGYDLKALLAVAAPEPLADFDPFWRDLRACADAVAVEPMLWERPSPQPHTRVFEIAFTSLDGIRIGGWLTRPRDEPVERGVVVSHGYGGREEPDFHLPFRRAALIFPCARGISRSARADLPSNPDAHVLHGIERPETYI